MNRRRFLGTTSAGLLATTLTQRASAQRSPRLAPFVDQLPIPPVLRPGVGPNTIGMTQFQSKLHRDLPPTTLWGYNGSYPGPTIETRRGSPIMVNWQNNIPHNHPLQSAIDRTLHGGVPGAPDVRTVVHLHGLKVLPESDGYPDAWFSPGYGQVGPYFTTRTYLYPNDQRATTLWYHDHAVAITRLNVHMGLTGMYIIRDATGGQSPPFQPPTVAELAAEFPQLEILELIGKGGMGAVYKARQKQLDRIVALKILPPGIGDDPAFAERFAREAKALAKLNHPGIVTLYEFGQADGLFYFFLMEFVDGVNLRQLLARRPRFAARGAGHRAADLRRAAIRARPGHRPPRHQAGEHPARPPRPGEGGGFRAGEDCWDGSGSPAPARRRMASAPAATARPALTDAGKIMGTPQYMAPEQIEHPGEVDHRADIYALGVVFYQMLTGELPGKTHRAAVQESAD